MINKIVNSQCLKNLLDHRVYKIYSISFIICVIFHFLFETEKGYNLSILNIIFNLIVKDLREAYIKVAVLLFYVAPY